MENFQPRARKTDISTFSQTAVWGNSCPKPIFLCTCFWGHAGQFMTFLKWPPFQTWRKFEKGAHLRNTLGFWRPLALNQVSKVGAYGSELIKCQACNRCSSKYQLIDWWIAQGIPLDGNSHIVSNPRDRNEDISHPGWCENKVWKGHTACFAIPSWKRKPQQQMPVMSVQEGNPTAVDLAGGGHPGLLACSTGDIGSG